MPLSPGPVQPFDSEPGEWLRCAFHVHTTQSDGWLTPVTQRRHHVMGGFDVLAITDHDRFTEEPAGDDDLVIIGGTELSLTAPKSCGPLHVLGIGVTSQPAVDRDASLAEAAHAVKEAGGLAYLAHPVWSGLRTDEVDGIEHCAGVEIFNASSSVEQDRGHNDAHTDIWLSMGHRLSLIATDDTHHPGFDSYRAWTMVHAAGRNRDAVMTALAAGRFYSTSGPRILGLTIDDGTLTVRTSPVQAITALANPPYGAQVRAGFHSLAFRGRRLRSDDGHMLEGIADGEQLTGAEFDWVPGVRYVRIVATDAFGNRAWSNPIWADWE
jgi:hypothetical protein